MCANVLNLFVFCDFFGMSKSFDICFSLGMFYQRSTNMPLWMIKWLTSSPMHLSRFHKLILKNISPTLKKIGQGETNMGKNLH